MLELTVYEPELFDDEKQEFVQGKAHTLKLEHSLVSLSKWESIWEKPFLGSDDRTPEEVLSYVECMLVDCEFPPGFMSMIDETVMRTISDYINSKMTATWFSDNGSGRPNREIITAELIYYWMNVAKIPIECERWHLNKLITLIRVHSAKNEPPKKKSQSQLAAERRALNEKRLAEMGTTG